MRICKFRYSRSRNMNWALDKHGGGWFSLSPPISFRKPVSYCIDKRLGKLADRGRETDVREHRTPNPATQRLNGAKERNKSEEQCKERPQGTPKLPLRQPGSPMNSSTSVKG